MIRKILLAMIFLAGSAYCEEPKQIILEGLSVKSLRKNGADIIVVLSDAAADKPVDPVKPPDPPKPQPETSGLQKIYDGDNGTAAEKLANKKKLIDIYTLISIKSQDSAMKSLAEINESAKNEAKNLNESLKATREYLGKKMTDKFPDDIALTDENRLKIRDAGEAIVKELRGIK